MLLREKVCTMAHACSNHLQCICPQAIPVLQIPLFPLEWGGVGETTI